MPFKEWYRIRESETGTGDIAVLRVCEGTCGDRMLDGENELLKEEGVRVLVEAGDLRYVPPLYKKVEMCVGNLLDMLCTLLEWLMWYEEMGRDLVMLKYKFDVV